MTTSYSSEISLTTGQRFAYMELKVVLATILRNFNIESTQKREDVKPNPGLVLQPSTGIWARLTNRTDHITA